MQNVPPVLAASSINIEMALEDLEDVQMSEAFGQSVATPYRLDAQIEAAKKAETEALSTQCQRVYPN